MDPLWLLFLLTSFIRSVNSASTTGDIYLRCPNGMLYTGGSPSWFHTVPSLYACLFLCGRMSSCQSINACPWSGSTDFSCNLFDTSYGYDNGCAGLTISFLPSCFHMVKVRGGFGCNSSRSCSGGGGGGGGGNGSSGNSSSNSSSTSRSSGLIVAAIVCA